MPVLYFSSQTIGWQKNMGPLGDFLELDIVQVV